MGAKSRPLTKLECAVMDQNMESIKESLKEANLGNSNFALRYACELGHHKTVIKGWKIESRIT